MPALSLLLIEDNINIAKNIAEYMGPLGHSMDFANNGKQGLALALDNYYDLIILDLMLPKMDGLRVCERIRAQAERYIPILMLTARDTLDDKVEGFDKGADDYLTKPFALRELERRCCALARRRLLHSSSQITVGELVVDREKKQVLRAGRGVYLQKIPFTILLILIETYPRVVSRSELCQRIWGDDFTESDALRSHIYQLRQALDKPFDYAMLKTLHGVGFVLQTQSDWR